MTLPVLGDWIIFSDTQLHHTWPLQWIILTIQMMNFFKLVYGGLFQTPNDNQCSSFRHVPLKIIVINTPVSYTMIISKLSIHSDYHCDWNQCSLQWFFGDQCNLHWFEVWILPTVFTGLCATAPYKEFECLYSTMFSHCRSCLQFLSEFISHIWIHLLPSRCPPAPIGIRLKRLLRIVCRETSTTHGKDWIWKYLHRTVTCAAYCARHPRRISWFLISSISSCFTWYPL